MVCAVTAFYPFLLIYVSSQAQRCVRELSPVWVTAQCNGLREFSSFSLATLVFFGLLFQPSSTLECCLLYPHLITLCGAAGVIVLSQVLFASAVQWFAPSFCHNWQMLWPPLLCVAFLGLK